MLGELLLIKMELQIINFYNPLISQEDLNVSVICHNRNRYEGSISIINNQPYVSFSSYTVNDAAGNNNGMPDYDEAMFLSLEMTNLGDQDAHDCKCYHQH